MQYCSFMIAITRIKSVRSHKNGTHCISFCPAEPDRWSYKENSVDPVQLGSKETIWSGSTLFKIQTVNLLQLMVY